MYAQSIQVIPFDRPARAGRTDRIAARRAELRTVRRSAVHAAASRRTVTRDAEARTVSATRPVRVRRRSAAAFLRSVICSLLLVSFFFLCTMYFRASAQEAAADHKYYTSITVGYGEDFMDLVAPYSSDTAHYPEAQDYLKEVCEINRLAYNEDHTTLRIHAGDTVIVPYYSQEVLP